MGFDKHFNEDHCYLEEADHVAMNVEIIDDACPVTPGAPDKSSASYSDDTIISNRILKKENFEENDKYMKVMSNLVYPDYCIDHEGMFLHEDEKLVKPGDKFSSHEEFVNYLNDNAKRWFFYYKCSDSRKPSSGNELYIYNCVYLKSKEKYKKRGLRKRSLGMRTDCPCKIKLKQLGNEKELTVVHVCNHHDHELSEEEFYKLQHGRRLPPYVREEIMDFLALRFDFRKIRAYVEMETGFSMSRAFFYALQRNMKSKNIKRYLSEERLNDLWNKINAVNIDDDNTDDHMEEVQTCNDNDPDTSETSTTRRREKDKNAHAHKKRSKLTHGNIASKKCKQGDGSPLYNSNEAADSGSHLQESVKCETLTNPWVSDQCVPVLPNRTADDSTEEPTHIEIKVDNNELSNIDNENGKVTYAIQYIDENGVLVQEIIDDELSSVIEQIDANSTIDGDYIACETVVTEDGNFSQQQHEESNIENDVTQIDNDQSIERNEDFCVENESTFIENGMECNKEAVESIQYLDETNGHDVAVQTSTDQANMLMPVFDVYMKDGNVTGFVVNNDMIHGVKDAGIDKEVQTIEKLRNNCDTTQVDTDDEHCDTEIIYEKTGEKTDSYTKHEYVHKHNIDRYMIQSHFPKYIKTLAKQTNADVLKMLSNVYRERGMFKMTTTQRGREGNTRIWYISETPKFRKPVVNSSEHLEEIMILKDKVKALQKQNSDLAKRNKYLEDVALKLLNG